MRIVGGRLSGRTLKAPATDLIRPTSDRLRESVFNIIAHAYGGVADKRVIDLFAGTGALALEAVSRGARFALLVDDGSEARALIRANVEALGLGGATRIFRRDARKLGDAPAGDPFDLAFLDPPYRRDLAMPTLCALRDGGWLREDALVVIEDATIATISVPNGYRLDDQRTFGDTQIVFLRTIGTDPEKEPGGKPGPF